MGVGIPPPRPPRASEGYTMQRFSIYYYYFFWLILKYCGWWCISVIGIYMDRTSNVEF